MRRQLRSGDNRKRTSHYVNYAPEQAWLLPPPRLDEELGEDHPACFLHECVEHLDLSAFEAGSSETGRPEYQPELLLKVWLCA